MQNYFPLVCPAQCPAVPEQQSLTVFPFGPPQQDSLVFAAQSASVAPWQQFMAVLGSFSPFAQQVMAFASLPAQQDAFAASVPVLWQHSVAG